MPPCHIHQYCCCLYLIGCTQLRWLHSQAILRCTSGLRPRTQRTYQAAFQLFLAFAVYMNVVDPWTDHVILAYMELLAQNNFSSVTVKNHLSVLSHYFQLYSWPIQGLQSRQVLMFVRSLKYNGLVKPKVKGVLNMVMLQQLVDLTLQRLHADTLVPLYLLSFFGFFRLASLVLNRGF